MKISPLVLAAFLVAGPAAADETATPDAKSLITPAVIEGVRDWIDTEIVRLSVTSQNARLRKLDQAKIDALDNQWKEERKVADKPLIAATLSNPLSNYLIRMQGRSLGFYVEIFVMDQNGLNVGQSSITSDFWQGDEAKFQKTYDVGTDAVFIDEPEWDDESKIWRAQVSYTLNDESQKNKLGAVTVELNLTELQRRAAFGS